MPPATAVIRGKIAAPSLSDRFAGRPRLESALAAAIDRRRLVVVTATAGSGKTSAVVAATRLVERPIAWLTVDRTDTSPGRLVTYLEAALARPAPGVAGVATGALAAGIPHAEAAGLLADALVEPVVVVVDELERLADSAEAWAVVEAVIRYAPDHATVVLVSRREIPTDLCALPAPDEVAVFGDAELAFTAPEAAAALSRADKAQVDAAAAVQATGGWVTGVLFEAWRSDEHVAGVGGEADPLHGYLSSHILGELDTGQREFLVTTSLLDEVSAQRAEALGLAGAGEQLGALRTAHLPVSWDATGTVMRCHSRFREYLFALLERRPQDDLRALRVAHARLLASEGQHEEATEEFLRAGAPTDALPSAEQALVAVAERLDLAVAQRWLDALADVPAATTSFAVNVARLMLAVARDDIREGVRIVDALQEHGERDGFVRSSELATSLAAWCYFHAGRTVDVHGVLLAAEPGPVVDALRYAMSGMTDPPGEDKPVAPELTGRRVDTVVYVADYCLGRLHDLAQAPASRWTEAIMGPWRIGALRATGHVEQALELYQAASAGSMAQSALHASIGPEVLIDAGRRDEARTAIAHGRRLARDNGSLALQGLNTLADAKLALRLDHDPEAARAAIERPESRRSALGFRFIDEMRDTWLGLALLQVGEDGAALTRLRRAVDGMVAGDRILELPTAAVSLAEALWRAGDEEGADRAADLALDAARRQGSNHVLLQALSDFPAVVARRIDAEAGADSPWHELGRALVAQGVTVGTVVAAAVQLREFGTRSLLVNGDEVRPRIAKIYELLAYLVVRGADVERQELLNALFEGRADVSSRSYLSQALNGLRQVLPPDAVIIEGSRVGLGDGVGVASESTRFESMLAHAARLQGAERLAATQEALALYDGGEYLPGRRSAWTHARAEELAGSATGARYEAAELALTAGRYDDARRLVEQVLAADHFHEPAWRLAMRIAETQGDQQGVVRAYRDCEEALARLDASPSPATRELLARLRR